MATEKENKPVSRRGFLGTSLFLPFLSVKKPLLSPPADDPDEEFTTMLTSKGGVVRVRKAALKNAKVVKKNMSNKSLRDWLMLKVNG